MTDIRDYLGKELLFYDGGTGTYLQSHGIAAGELPESANLTSRPEMVRMHREFLGAGSHILLANTFGANPGKLAGSGWEPEELIRAGVENAREAVRQFREERGEERPLFVSMDIGPSGRLMKPYGDLEFEEAYEWFCRMAVCGEEAGADLITIETMSDSYEVKAALLAAKENTSLPVFVTMTFDEGGRLLTGGEVEGTAALLEGLGADAIGFNCGLGPHQLLGLAQKLLSFTNLPVIVNPNAGLPRSEGGRTVYDVGPEEFAEVMGQIARAGAWVLGGCCGTTPEHIACLTQELRGFSPVQRTVPRRTVVTSGSRFVEISRDPVIIGERINPTGKKWLKTALQEGDTDRILKEAVKEQEDGAHILDVNVGLPGLDEAETFAGLIPAIQAVTDLPLQIDTSNVAAMERALRLYNGKPMINSVNGKKESMEQVFPLAKRYGGVVVGLCLDEEGIPDDVEGRLRIARRILDTAAGYGIKREDIVIDALALTVSAQAGSARVTLETIRRLKEELGVNTVLGVSNISFGLPAREVINASFFAMALSAGLSCGIINPGNEAMRDAYDSYRALYGLDENCSSYIARNSERKERAAAPFQTPSSQAAAAQAAQERLGAVPSGPASSEQSQETAAQERELQKAIETGLSGPARTLTAALLQAMSPLEIIDGQLIPALDTVGKYFETGKLFLPQLLMSADAAGASFEVIRAHMERSGETQAKKGKIILATVKGDIHDIGKNIVKALLQNYGYEILDLGKDVEPEAVVDAARRAGARLVGLSALMTTTVVYMEETIRLLRESLPEVKIMVGGAVLTQEYAQSIGADFYGKDAMASVRYAEQLSQQGLL